MLQEGNLTINDSCQIHDGILSPFLPIGYIVICCIGLLCNTITLYIFFFREHADTSMVVYMRHLTLADTLLVMCLPLRVYYHNKEGPFYLCKVVGIFFYLNMYSSILFLSLISLDRYLKIIKPVWVFRIQKTKWSHMASYIIWVILILGVIPFFTSNNHEHPCDKICFHFHSKGLVGGTINLTTLLLFLVFYVAFLCFYLRITKRLRTMSMGNGDPKAQIRKKRVIIKTFLVPAIFTLCFLPYHAVRIPYVLAQLNVIRDLHSQQLLHILNESTLLLSTLNSCLDPIIYYFLSSAYRKTILCAIQGKFKNMHSLNSRRVSINQN
ncbi:G protein-coupled receptor 34 like isoform X2 [Labeo rohita]|uniref:G protein-coupled receptor 34 like isoform X2 n=1 Tax=Labeo rohita TaxID=84645 RepID=UPI0021E32B31|nr:G protein-coupled receptor 34 like isoform X2 [Labeo rohita]XP_050949147.1 G protein-coupled receptor 34 like isoform X2 [Labeo rohita]